MLTECNHKFLCCYSIHTTEHIIISIAAVELYCATESVSIRMKMCVRVLCLVLLLLNGFLSDVNGTGERTINVLNVVT